MGPRAPARATKAPKFRPPDLKEFRMSRHFRFIVFSPTRLFCLPRSGATDYPLLVAVSSGTNPCSGRRFVCNDLRQGYWKGLSLLAPLEWGRSEELRCVNWYVRPHIVQRKSVLPIGPGHDCA